MMKSIWNFLSERTATIGGDLLDADLRTQKIVLVSLSLSAFILGPIWAVIEYSVRDQKSAIATGVVALLIILNLLIYAYSKKFYFFRFSQLTVFITFPVILHFVAGGFTKSANLTWSLGTPLVALLSSKPREARPWFIAYLVIISISGIVDPLLFSSNSMSVDTSFFEFSFNIINISVIVYLMLIYFVNQKKRVYRLLDAEKLESERLLLNVLPKEVAIQLKQGKKTIADGFEHASVLFADIARFTPLSAQWAPREMVVLMNQIFSEFDLMVERYNLEKIRSIGDNYMVASGIPRPMEDHAQVIASLALDIRNYIGALPKQNGEKIQIRIGINSGPVIGGVIGKHKFHYDVWGDAVNTASRMESQGVAGKIQIAQATHDLIKDAFVLDLRGSIPIKGKGEMNTWFLLDKR